MKIFESRFRKIKRRQSDGRPTFMLVYIGNIGKSVSQWVCSIFEVRFGFPSKFAIRKHIYKVYYMILIFLLIWLRNLCHSWDCIISTITYPTLYNRGGRRVSNFLIGKNATDAGLIPAFLKKEDKSILALVEFFFIIKDGFWEVIEGHFFLNWPNKPKYIQPKSTVDPNFSITLQIVI